MDWNPYGVPGKNYVAEGYAHHFDWDNTVPDDKEAVEHYTSAAEVENPEDLTYGICYVLGKGVSQDFSKARELLQQFADKSQDTKGRLRSIGRNFGREFYLLMLHVIPLRASQ